MKFDKQLKQLKQLNLNKVLTNKYVLYTIVVISFLNILGYLALNNLNAIIYFSLIGLLTYQFTKNMSIVLGISLVLTNLLMTNRLLREGLDNMNMESTNKNKDMLKGTLGEHDEEIKKAIDDIKSSSSLEEAKEKIKNNRTKINEKKSSTRETETETNEPTGVSSMTNMQGNKSKEPRIDYATTLSDSYTQLQNMLGPRGMEGLTNDTKQLAEQQAQLIKQMESMMPLVQDAQKMLQGFDIKGLSNLTNMLQPSPVK